MWDETDEAIVNHKIKEDQRAKVRTLVILLTVMSVCVLTIGYTVASLHWFPTVP